MWEGEGERGERKGRWTCVHGTGNEGGSSGRNDKGNRGQCRTSMIWLGEYDSSGDTDDTA